MSILLYGHGGSGNHGCEAIVRSTTAILKHSLGDPRILLATQRAADDSVYLEGVADRVIDITEREKNIDYLVALLRLKLTHNYVPFDIYPYKSLIHQEHPTMALSVGGDNYCYGNTTIFRGLNCLFRDKGIKTVLWGCSIEPDALTPDVIADLNNYSLVVARESITYEAVKSSGIKNVMLYPDPAFTLPVADHSEMSGMEVGKDFVGINLSPYVSKCEKSKGLTMLNFRSLVDHIMKNTNFNVALIPHVNWKHSDDRTPLKELYDEFSESGRVKMIEDDKAEFLKGIISKCRFMVAARTHASIAAYSTCVPTLVVGYSVKAKGIAKDIFGSYEDYVLPVQSLESPDDLTDKFKWMVDHETEIRNQLSSFMPGYIARAWEAGDALKTI